MPFLLPNQQRQSTEGNEFLHFKEIINFLKILIHTHMFNGPFSGTTLVTQYQKGKTNLDFTEAKDMSGSGISWAIWLLAPDR